MQFLVSEKYRFLLGWSAKGGCSSIKSWFLDVHNIKPPADGNVHKFIGYGGTEYSYVDWGDPERYQNYQKFLVVRDPYKRLVSGFVNKYVGRHFANDGWDNFSEFVQVLADDPKLKRINRHHFTPQFSEAYADFAEHYSFDSIIRLKQLREGLNSISSLTGAPQVDVRKHNTSKHAPDTASEKHVSSWSIAKLKRNRSKLPPPESFYNYELVQLVEKIYQLDFYNLLKLGMHYPRPPVDEPEPSSAPTELTTDNRWDMEPSIPKVSIVIPVYNTAKFLRQCLDSVLNQTLVDIEVLVVDDCSSDDSHDVIKEYRRKDRRVKALTHEFNQGLPATRNTGMAKATGEYLIHLDSDDFWVEERMLEQLYTLARLRGSDVIKFGGRVYEDGHFGQNLTNVKSVYASSFLDEPSFWHFNSTFLYFCKRSFLEEKSIRFTPGISIGEDQIYVAAVLTAANTVSAIDQAFYAYRVNSQSMMRRRWTSVQFREEIEHSRIVTTTLREFPEIRLNFAKVKISYWRRQIFPRAFEDLGKADRLEFFRNAATLVQQFDESALNSTEDLTPPDLRLLEMLRRCNEVYLEEHFREEVNPNFSKFCPTNMYHWPPYSLNQQHAGDTSNKIAGTIYIHAGIHKTGSTAIQDFLYKNRAKLAEDGIHYCHSAGMWGPNAHLLPISLVGTELHLLGWPSLDADRIWRNITADYHASGCKDLLLSSEFFTPEYLDNELPDLRKLKSLLGENTVRFIFYVRPQDSRLESGYAQLVHSGVRALQQPFNEYVEASLKSQDYAWLLQEYEQVFGRESLLVNRYQRDDFEQNNVCRDVTRILELDSDQYSFTHSEQNETWHNDVVEFIQKSNTFPLNHLSIAQKDRFGHYVRAWFSHNRSPFAQGTSSRLTPELHDRLVSHYRQSNREVSERYLPDSRSLAIGDWSESATSDPAQELTSESTTCQMLLDTWARVDTLEQNVECLKKRHNPELRIRQYLSRALKKTLNRIKTDIKSVPGRLTKLRTDALRSMSRTIPVRRRFRNAEGQAEYNFSLSSGRKPAGISAMLRVKNEEALIHQCLDSIYDTFDEIVVIDNGSEDRTLELVRQFASEHDHENKIQVEQYPFNIARCGTEHENTSEDSLHSLVYYYNWCLSRCTRSYVCKWDADLLLNSGQPARERLRQFLTNSSRNRPLVVGQLDVQTIYIDKNGSRFHSNHEVNREVRAFPNTASIFFEKAPLWEQLKIPPDIPMWTFSTSGIEEIKDVRLDEFSHWTPGAALSPRKELEFENYNLIKQKLVEVFPTRFSPEQAESSRPQV